MSPVCNVLFPVSPSSSSSSPKPPTHMSASGTSFPDPDWPRQDPTRPDLPFSHHLPPDPLLDAGSFVDSSSSALPAPTLPSRDLDRTPRKKAESSSTPRSPLRAGPLNSFNLPPDSSAPRNGDSPATKKVSLSASSSRGTTDASLKSALSERPNWLPPGWVVQDRVRSSGATAGTVDKYYFDPISNRRFRSKIEVLYFLETGTLRKRKKSLDGNPTSTDGSEEPKSKKSSSNAKSAPLNFDFFNVPEKVEWVLTDPSKDAWTPFIGSEKVRESTKRAWVGAFQLLGRSKV
ncbi:LOW QUALITY PROTEIN: methyl-CpG-binding domain-containing protein 6 [Benincasa hispida]|uniref:LOW QUALITY PROTEIN: methyl-CpG-binding domain-containing protein 6 n=1 Tax=Benincasa hispida TaxID=102211 RepID=UPI00190131AD|nr:LOW QUALITY PROTEIN: methyl-CpG-binding domain-containing protein 6 [Benincasa hispida]